MKKTLIFAFTLFSLSSVSCGAQQQNYYDPNQNSTSTPAGTTTLDPQTREEVRQTYRQAAGEMKRLAGEFRTFYDELKTIVKEEGIADLPKELGIEDEDSSFGRADVIEEDKEMIVQMDMPGVEKKDIQIRLKDMKVLEVEAKRAEARTQQTQDVVQSERYAGAFRREIELPAEAAPKGFKAELVNGVLTVRIPKAKPGAAPNVQSIPIS